MPSFKTTAVAVIALLVSAQAQYTINPNSVPLATREKWCTSQEAACPLLCLQLPGSSSTTAANTCDPTTLTYNCVCGNGQSPNATEYSQTLPYYICQEWGQQCVANCGNNNNDCQAACTQDHPCGAQNPVRVNVTSTSSTLAATATGTDVSGSAATGTVYNGFGSGGAETTTAAAGASTSSSTSTSSNAKSGAQAALTIGRSYGVMVIAAGLFAGFALLI